jgi:hypothetical protein
MKALQHLPLHLPVCSAPRACNAADRHNATACRPGQARRADRGDRRVQVDAEVADRVRRRPVEAVERSLGRPCPCPPRVRPAQWRQSFGSPGSETTRALRPPSLTRTWKKSAPEPEPKRGSAPSHAADYVIRPQIWWPTEPKINVVLPAVLSESRRTRVETALDTFLRHTAIWANHRGEEPA